MKISVSTYSYKNTDQFDCIAMAADAGFDGIEFTELTPPEGEDKISFAKRIKAEAERVGIEISNYSVGAKFIWDTDEELDAEIERVKGCIDVAEVLGVKRVRHDAATAPGRYRTFDGALPVIAEGCRKITEYAEAKGIKTMIENHGYFCQGAERCEKIVAAVNHPNFGLLADMGNMLFADSDPAVSFGRIAPYTEHVHAKDFHIKLPQDMPGRGYRFTVSDGRLLRGAIIGHGDVPVIQCLKALKRVGYDGYVSIEFEGMEEPVEAIGIGLENLKKYIDII